LFTLAEHKGGWETLSKMVLDQDREEQTALHLAVENGHYEIVLLLIEKGTNVNCVKVNLVAPLHLATTNGHLDIVQLLLNYDANIEAKTAMQRTPLMRAATFNRLEILNYLWKKYVLQFSPLQGLF
jgi:transient receptor potential cation channel subfamily A protein 1